MLYCLDCSVVAQHRLASPQNFSVGRHDTSSLALHHIIADDNATTTLYSYDSVTMVGPSPHRPRRKAKKTTTGNDSEVSSVAPPASSRSSSSSSSAKPAYPLAAFLWPARSSVSKWEILPLILMAVGLFRWAAGLWGYSGIYGFRDWQRLYADILQDSKTPPCTATTKLKDTGWR